MNFVEKCGDLLYKFLSILMEILYYFYYTLLFHSLLKVEFYIAHFVLGEHWER